MAIMDLVHQCDEATTFVWCFNLLDQPKKQAYPETVSQLIFRLFITTDINIKSILITPTLRY